MRKRPAYAVSPLPPSTPRYACGGATARSSFVSVATPPSAGAPGLDDRVVAPTGRVPDRVARLEAVGVGLDDLADGEDPVHRRLERERGEVSRRPVRAQPQPERGVDGRPRVADEHLARPRLRHLDLDDAEVGRPHLAARIRDQLNLAAGHARRSESTSRPIRSLFASSRSTPTARVPM